MKIVFICGSLESGHDGVGDYTRMLASELIKQGMEAAALAINDFYINEPLYEIQTIGNINVNTYRIPSKLTSKKRFEIASEWLDSVSPAWLSLQFVLFSFNKKGLPFNLAKNLSHLTKDRCWHIMFHELWVGMEEEASIKHKLWGYIQKYLIKKLIQQLHPSLITTQTKLYQIQLNELGNTTEHLPLFSNIPIKEHIFRSINNQKKITFVNFGTIHPGASIESFAEEAAIYKQKNKIEFDLILIGRCGKEQSHWTDVWKSFGLNMIILGEQSVDRISEVFNTATFGISTTALPLIEKSGSVAAMLEHNLPVICISKLWNPTGIKNLPVAEGVVQYLTGNFEFCLTKEITIDYTNVSTVSERLLEKIYSFK